LRQTEEENKKKNEDNMEEKRLLGSPRRRWELKLKRIVKK
jgi:hypothetical protein